MVGKEKVRTEIIYFDNANDWVESLHYERPINGYVFGNPFKSKYGENPYTVYERLFKAKHHYVISNDELNTLKTTIQYMPVYLDEYCDKVIKFFKKCGFEIYKKEGKYGDLRNIYVKRNNISIYFANQFQPQDYEPNLFRFEIGEFRYNKNNGKRRRHIIGSYKLKIDDELGNKTKQNLEKLIKNTLKEIIDK